MVPSDVPKMKFSIYQHPKSVEDDPVLFPIVARIPDARRRQVHLANPVLVTYLTTINPNDQVGALLPKGAKGTSKIGKVSKKPKKPEQTKSVPEPMEKEVTKIVQELVAKVVQKEVIPSKTGIPKHTKKPAHHPRHSPKPPFIEEYSNEPTKEDFVTKIRKNCKPQFNRRGVRIRELPAPVSPASNKRKANEVVKKIKKNKN